MVKGYGQIAIHKRGKRNGQIYDHVIFHTGSIVE